MTGARARLALGLIAAGSIVLFAGCGYHTAGKGTRLPATVQTIAVPAFANRTQQYKVEQMLTQAVVRELIVRTKYRIVNKVEPDADAILKGTVTSIQISPVTFDTTTGRVSSVLVTVGVSVSLVDRKGKVLFENPGYTFREQYQITQDISTFFEETSPALHRLSDNFARTLVSDVLEAF